MTLRLRKRQLFVRVVACAFGVVAIAGSSAIAAAAPDIRTTSASSDLTWEQAFRHNLAQLPPCGGSAASAASSTEPELRTAAEPGPTTWTHNISGAAVNLGRDCAVNPLIFAIASQSNNPLAIGIQEACRTQAEHLLQWLQTNKNENYRMEFRTQNREPVAHCADPDTSTTDFGIALYAIGKRAPGPGDELPWEGTFAYQSPADGESRGWTCIRSVFPYSACTSHMTWIGSDDGEARDQARQMFDVTRQIIELTGEPVFWSGDFYMTPRGLSELFGDDFFKEEPEGDIYCRNSTVRDTVYNGEPERKVDYVFRTTPVDCTPNSGPDKDAVVWPDVPPAECRDACLNYNHKLVGGFL